MSIRFKIIIAFLTMTILLMVQSLFSLKNNGELRELVHLAIDKNYKVIDTINDILSDMEQLSKYENGYFIYIMNPVEKVKYTRQWKETFDDLQKELDQMIRDNSGRYAKEDKLRFVNWKYALQFYEAEFEKILRKYQKSFVVENARNALDRESISVQANGMIRAGRDRLEEAFKDMKALRSDKVEESLSIVQGIESHFHWIETISFTLTGIAVLITILIVILIPGGINQSLKRLNRDAERISKGHLSEPISGLPIPEFDALARSLEVIRKARIADSLRSANRRQSKEKILLEEE